MSENFWIDFEKHTVITKSLYNDRITITEEQYNQAKNAIDKVVELENKLEELELSYETMYRNVLDRESIDKIQCEHFKEKCEKLENKIIKLEKRLSLFKGV